MNRKGQERSLDRKPSRRKLSKHKSPGRFSLKKLAKDKRFWLAVSAILIVVAVILVGIWLIFGTRNEQTNESSASEQLKAEQEISAEAEGQAEPEEHDEAENREEPAAEPKQANGQSKPAQPNTVQSTASNNCTTSWGNLMLINPNFTVDRNFIASRRTQLISVSKTYGISEYRSANGDNLLTPEAATHLNEMVKAYQAANPGHTMGTRSCFRERGTNCGRLCAATGTSDHHTGLTCDLIDNHYGTELNTDDYAKHLEWQWLRANSYRFGFIDRFPEAWAGGSMSEPLNMGENGATGLFETWHYRYVGVEAATEIAQGKYNNGRYDSLEHYLKMTGRVANLKNAICNR